MRPARTTSTLVFVMLLASAVVTHAGHVVLLPAERRAASRIRPDVLRAHIRFLASDLLEGRGAATRGDRLTQLYIATEMETLGLQPAAPDGTWFQNFDLVGVTTHAPKTLTFTRAAETVDLQLRDDYIAVSGVQAPEVRVDQAEVVFVGYGIVAPEYGWDDYKGADLKGKIVLVMNNDPEDDPRLFAGKTRLYYGRWDYKYEQAAKMGAVGAIVIHTTPSAGYPWQVVQTSWSGEQFSLPAEGGLELQVKAWVTEDSAKRIARLGAHDLDALRTAALTKDFRPVPLGVTSSIQLSNDVQKAQTANVIGRIPGSDPILSREAVLYTAHHDHLGVKEDARPGEDAIYNGAIDNASGVAAMLAIAGAMKALPEATRRSVLFAAVGAEESGLLGSKYLALHPPLPVGRLAADINIDGINVWGRTRDITMIGLGKSSLDEWIRGLSTIQGRRVLPDQFPDRGYFYRSDQFNFAKMGVPSAYFDSGTDYIGKPPEWGKRQQEHYEATDYHQPSDEMKPDWDFSGAVEDVRLFYWLGVKVANAAAMPTWNRGDEFEAARKKALAERR